MPLILGPLTTSDTLSWTRIRTKAYYGPTHNLVHSRPVSEDTIQKAAESRKHEIDTPNKWHWKIVDTDLPPGESDPEDNGGMTIAIAIWSAHGVYLSKEGRRSAAKMQKTDASGGEEESTSIPVEVGAKPKEILSGGTKENPPFLPPEVRLDVLTALFTPLREACTEIMGSRPYLMLNSLATHPDHQRRGAGRMLVKWGIEVADRAALEIYLDTSRAGRKMYESEGFRLVREVGFDRKDWGGEGMDWHGCMVREPDWSVAGRYFRKVNYPDDGPVSTFD